MNSIVLPCIYLLFFSKALAIPTEPSGGKADINKFPYVVSIRTKGLSCTGSLIAPDKVLTSALCVKERLSTYTVHAGSDNLSLPDEVRTVSEICIHPKFMFPYRDYNVAVLTLERPFELNAKISTISLPPENYSIKVDSFGNTTGWGKTSYWFVLKYYEVKIIHPDVCKYLHKASNHTVCIDYMTKKKDACFYDSGNPLIDGIYQIGMASYNTPCTKIDYPRDYVSIAHQDINHHIQKCMQK